MRKRKLDRRKQFHEVVEDIQKISSEIYGSADHNILVDEADLSLRRLEELHRQLHELDKEKVGLFSSFFIIYVLSFTSCL